MVANGEWNLGWVKYSVDELWFSHHSSNKK